MHNELWVPANELEEFNSEIIDGIKIDAGYFGEKFEMPKEDKLAKLIADLR